VVIGLSKNKIVIAADSRRKASAGVYDDHICKVTAFGGKFVFTMSGRANFTVLNSSDPSGPPITDLDALDEARIAFRSATADSTDFLADAANAWGRHVVRIFQESISAVGPATTFSDIPDGPVTTGFFAGQNVKGELIAYIETVNHRAGNVWVDAMPVSLPDSINYIATGKTDTVAELRDNKLPWVLKETAAWEKQSVRWTDDESAVLKAIRWIDLTLAANPDSDEVGGAIDSVILKPNSRPYWRTRKQECQGDQ